VRFRYSLGLLLLVMLWTAGYLGGYRFGFTSGKQARSDLQLRVVCYPVADLMRDWVDTPEDKQQFLDEFVDLVTSTVEHDSWMQNGTGRGEIQPFPANDSLVVSQTGRVHEQIAALLEQLRKANAAIDVNNAIALFQSFAATKNEQPLVLRSAPRPGVRAVAAMDALFDAAVQSLADHFGEPEFAGPCSEKGFPEWSLAQRLATWRRGDGEAYLALQDDPTSGRVILAGWKAND
jgi:hypothetical protein